MDFRRKELKAPNMLQKLKNNNFVAFAYICKNQAFLYEVM
jgi:hypothetical protein